MCVYGNTRYFNDIKFEETCHKRKKMIYFLFKLVGGNDAISFYLFLFLKLVELETSS